MILSNVVLAMPFQPKYCNWCENLKTATGTTFIWLTEFTVLLIIYSNSTLCQYKNIKQIFFSSIISRQIAHILSTK